MESIYGCCASHVKHLSSIFDGRALISETVYGTPSQLNQVLENVNLEVKKMRLLG